MSQLKGFDEYMKAHAGRSVFDEPGAGDMAVWHLHGPRVVRAKLVDHSAYEITLQPEDGEPLALHKTQVNFFHAIEHAEAVEERVKIDPEARSRKLEPILRVKDRHLVKNKTLYVLSRERTVVSCTLLDGEILRGLIGDFTQYEMTFLLKGGIPLTVLRHAILDLRDKEGRSQLKATQDRRKDWKKSALYLTPS